MVNWSWKMGLDEMCSCKLTHNGAVHMLELKYEIGAPLREAIEKATEAMDQFRIQFLDPFIISTPADRNSYRIKVNYRTK